MSTERPVWTRQRSTRSQSDNYHEAIARHLHAQVLEATEALAREKVQSAEALRDLHVKLLTKQAQCDAFERLCRDLVLIIEDAAERQDSAPEKPLDARTPGKARVSAA